MTTELTEAQRMLLAQRDREMVAYHEFAHWAVANHFSLYARVVFNKTSGRARSEGGVFSGICDIPEETTDFRLATIAWAGLIANAALGATDYSPDEALSLLRDSDWLNETFLDFMATVPEGTDLPAIHRCLMKWRSFKTSAAIMVKQWPKIQAEAEIAIRNMHLIAQ